MDCSQTTAPAEDGVMVKIIKTRQQHNKMDLNFGVSVAIMSEGITSEASLLPGECHYNMDDQSPFIERVADASFSRSVLGICSTSLERQNLAPLWMAHGWPVSHSIYSTESSCFQVMSPPLSSTEPRDPKVKIHYIKFI